LLYAALALIVVLGLGGALVVLVVANRAEADPSGRRPFVVYLFGVAFITLWTALLGSAAAVMGLISLIGRNVGVQVREVCGTAALTGARCTQVSVLHPVGDAAARAVVLGGLLLVVSAAAFLFHVRKGLDLAAGDTVGASARVARSYVSAVAFVSVLVVVGTTIGAVYAVFGLVAPGVFGAAGRVPALRSFLDAGYVAAAAFGILLMHMRVGFPGLWPWRAPASVPPAPMPGSPAPTGP
jgi:hypothetical protein